MGMDWHYKKIGEVCTVERGGSPRPIDDYITDSPDGINWIKIGDTSDSMFITRTAQKIKPEGMRKSRYVQSGDFLLSNSMSFGRPYILKIDGCIHDGWLVLRDNNEIFDKRFLYYYLSAKPTYEKFKMMAVGGVVNNLNSEMVRKVDVPIPAMKEQNAIADLLDKTNRIIAMKQQQLSAFDDLIKSRFVEMFGDPIENPKGWPLVTVSSFATVKIGPFGSMLHAEDYIAHGHPLINPSHIINNAIVPDCNLTLSNAKYEELSVYQLKQGDVIIGRRGEIGRCAVVEENGLFCGTGSMFVRIKGKCRPDYLQKIISFPTYRAMLEDKSVGITMKNLNAGIIADALIPLPSLGLQNEFAAFVQQLDKSKFAIQQSLAATRTLFDSLMQKYFG